MRTGLRIVLAISLAILIVAVAVAVVEGRRAVSNELTAVFRDATGDGVLSDEGGGYVSAASRAGWDRVLFERTYGKIIINLRTSSPAGRYLNLRFEEMLRNHLIVEPGGDGFDCRDYLGTQMNVPEILPPFPLSPSTTTTSFLIETMAQVTYNTTTEKWQSTGTIFNVRDDMEEGDTAYVGLNFYFSAAERSFWLNFNERQFGGLDLSMVPGFAQVTRSAPNTWLLTPIALVDGGPPLPITPEKNFANLIVHVPAVKKVHGAGYCDLGDWSMPYSITLTR